MNVDTNQFLRAGWFKDCAFVEQPVQLSCMLCCEREEFMHPGFFLSGAQEKIFLMPLIAIFLKKDQPPDVIMGLLIIFFPEFFPQVVSSSFRLFTAQQRQPWSTRIPVTTDRYDPFSIICLSNKCPRVYLEFIFYCFSVGCSNKVLGYKGLCFFFFCFS